MTYLIGQAPEDSCPVCDVFPVPLRPVPGFAELAECGRCGFVFTIRDLEGNRLPMAVPTVASALAAVYRRFYRESGRRCGLPAAAIEDPTELDSEQRARIEAFDEWVGKRPHLLAGAMAPASWPYVSLTAVRVEVDGRPTWQIVAPPAVVPMALLVPVSAENLPLGSVITISIPIDPFAAEPERATGPEGSA